MKNFRKISTVLLSSLLLTSAAVMSSCGDGTDTDEGEASNPEKEMYTVGIAQFGEHASLDNCREGFIEGLKQAGFVEGENIEFVYKNASFDTGNCTTIAQGFVSDGVDLMCAVATPIAQACYNIAEDEIPVVYTAITDPVGAALTTGEVTGTSDALPVEAQLKLIRELLPEAEKIGILYTTSEANSMYTIELYNELASDYGFEIVTKGITLPSEVPLAIESIMDEVDCFSNLTDNTVVGQLDVMLDKANEAGKPIFGSEIEQVKKGCVAAEGIEYFDLGVQTGKMAARILSGEAASSIPYETVTENHLYVNKAACEALEIELTDTVSERAEFVEAQ